MASAHPGRKMGLLGMRERVARVGGTMEIESRPGQRSEITGTPQAAASKRRTLGDQPAARISSLVTFSVNRCDA